MKAQVSKTNVARNVVVGGIALSAAAVAAYARIIRPWHLQWGASEQESRRVLPGDDMVLHPRLSYTRAITIHAPADQVWQWVVQLGQNRGGLYINEGFEKLFGRGNPSAERILPEFQNIQVGDYVLLYPNGPAYGVARVNAPHELILQTVNFATGEFTKSVERDGVHGSFLFMLEPFEDNRTRLLVRSRLDYPPTGLYESLWHLVEPVTFVMERQLLRGVKRRAEAHRVADELLDRVMPEYEFRGVESIVIHAAPEKIFQALSQVTGRDMPLAQIFGQLRYLPAQWTGHAQGGTAQSEPFLDLILKMGFVGLGEDLNREVVIGAIGKFHDLFDQQFVSLRDADEFQKFLHADFQKLAMSFRVLGDDSDAGCTLTLEHRTHALSEHARKQFARYWLGIKPSGSFVTQQLLRAVKRRAEARSNIESLPESLTLAV